MSLGWPDVGSLYPAFNWGHDPFEGNGAVEDEGPQADHLATGHATRYHLLLIGPGGHQLELRLSTGTETRR